MNSETSAVVQSVDLRAIDGYFYKIKMEISDVLKEEMRQACEKVKNEQF